MVLVSGRMAGVWEYERQRVATLVRVTMFDPVYADLVHPIEAEAARLGGYLGTPSKVVYP